MRRFPLWLCLFLLLSPASAIPQGRGRRVPPGYVDAEKHSNPPIEPPMEMRKLRINAEQVKQESEELRRLADGIPAQIQQVTNGRLPKDLSNNLKRIEKLAKRLRTETTP